MLILRGMLEIIATFRLHKEATPVTERAAILKSQHTFPQYASVGYFPALHAGMRISRAS